MYSQRMNKRLVLHIGLHKTATTMLQMNFYPQFSGYLGRHYARDTFGKRFIATPGKIFNEFEDVIVSYCQGQDTWEQALSRWVKRLDFSTNPVQILSNEHLTWWPSPLGLNSSLVPVHEPSDSDTPRRGQHPMTIFLERIRNFLPKEIDLLTIVTLRNQPEFLASWAAWNGVSEQGAIARVIERQDAFIDFFSLVTDLEKVIGKSNNLTLLFEDGVEKNCEKIIAFAGLEILDSAPTFEFQEKEESSVRENVGRVGDASWKLNNIPFYARFRLVVWARTVAGRRAPWLILIVRGMRNIFLSVAQRPRILSLSDTERVVVREYCAPSNLLLAQHLKRDLVSLGY